MLKQSASVDQLSWSSPESLSGACSPIHVSGTHPAPTPPPLSTHSGTQQWIHPHLMSGVGGGVHPHNITQSTNPGGIPSAHHNAAMLHSSSAGIDSQISTSSYCSQCAAASMINNRNSYAPLHHSRSTSINSYSNPQPPQICHGQCYKDLRQQQPTLVPSSRMYTSTPTPRNLADDEESTYPILCEREFHSLHRNVPALRRRDIDTAAIRSHYYPEGGWGWIVCGAGFLAHLLTSGLQLAFGLLYLYTIKHVSGRHGDRDTYVMYTAWMGALCLCISFMTSPFIVAICRRKSTRLTAVLGGLIMALACLFTSFATQYHQALLSYGFVLGAGAGMVRETSGLILAHYFKRRREFVEMVVQAGTGVGVALFSVLYKEAVGKLGWRLGLQAVTGLLTVGFFLGIVYRPASLYHPQRRAILHLKNQRKKVKEKKTHIRVRKPPLFDFSPLRSGTVRMLLAAAATASFGLYTPVFYLALQGYNEGLEDSALVILQTFLGFATALGCVGFGVVTVRPSSQCLISRQYLCQTAMVGIGISLLALSTVQGYHGYVLFVCLYGVCLGGFMYSLKMFTLERVRARHFTKAWGFVQGAESIPILLGVPITGYINQTNPKAGYYFSFIFTIIGAILLFFVGYAKKPEPSSSFNSNITTNSECLCPTMSPQLIAATHHDTFNRYHHNNYNPSSSGGANFPSANHYERVFTNPYTTSSQQQQQLSNNFIERGQPHRHSFKIIREPSQYATSQHQRRHDANLQKSLSYAAHMNYPDTTGHQPVHCITDQADFMNCNQYFRPQLRSSKSVPEGLASRWDHHHTWGSYRRPIIRNVQVIEQITTSV